MYLHFIITILICYIYYSIFRIWNGSYMNCITYVSNLSFMHIMHIFKRSKFNVKSVTVIVFVLYGSDGIFIFNALNLWRSNI